MNSTHSKSTDDMPTEIDFAGGVRGKFFKADAVLRLPVYLDQQIQGYLSERARLKGIELNSLVNELLQKDIELIEAVR